MTQATIPTRNALGVAELQRRRIARRELIPYCEYTMPGYQARWFHETIAKLLMLVLDGWVNRLMVFTPPRHGKTQLVSIQFPAMYLGHHPQRSVIGTSYAIDLARTNSRACRDTMRGDRHQQLFASRMNVASDTHWQIEHRLGPSGPYEPKHDRRNSFIAAGVGGGITGSGADLFIIDDPFKNYEEALSFVTRESRWNWFTTVARTRLAPQAAIVMVMTRWHEDDLGGRCLQRAKESKKADQYLVLELPAYTDTEDFTARLWSTSGFLPEGLEFPNATEVETNSGTELRFAPYAALWPDAYPRSYLDATLATMGTRQFGALFGATPRITEGNIIKRAWFRRWWVPTNYVELTGKPVPTDGTGLLPGYAFESCEMLPDSFDMLAQSWDLTFKDTRSSDFVAGHVYGRNDAKKYLLDRVNERMNFPETKRAIQAMSDKHPHAHAKWIEDKANGPAIIADLKDTLDGMIPIEPIGSKEARLSAAAPAAEAGDVILPHPSIAPWVYDFIEQLCGFGSLPHDDDCDAFSQAVFKMRSRKMGLVTFLNQETARLANVELARVEEVTARMTKKVASPESMAKIVKPVEGDACPECGGTTIQRVAGQKRCAACGVQWGATNQIAIPKRTDALAKMDAHRPGRM